MTESENRARQVLEACAARGVAEFVVCAGSRNSPLVLEILRSGARAWSFFEERSAGFFALGRCRVLHAPVAVVTTSGTAAAELWPAVIEAHYNRSPLLAITADRPARFRGTGAPQAIEQVGLFGEYARSAWDDAWPLEDWDGWGPAHLNVCFDEPLVSKEVRSSAFRRVETQGLSARLLVELEIRFASLSRSMGLQTRGQASLTLFMNRGHGSGDPCYGGHLATFHLDEITAQPCGGLKAELRTFLPREGLLVMLGEISPLDRPRVHEFLTGLQAPILADATSGLREALGDLILKSGERVLNQENCPKRVLRIGGVPSGRSWRDLENRPEIEVISVLAREFTGLARPSTMTELSALDVTGSPDQALLKQDRAFAAKLETLFRKFPSSEPALMAALSSSIPRRSTVFLGNSLPIREWNLAATYEDREFSIWSNRGANGIDGNLSTFLGLAADAPESWAVVGDLTALYDLAAPWILRDLPPGKRRLVIVNNGGGRIFSRLPVLKDLPMEQRQVTENIHGLNFRAWAEMWNLGYARIDNGGIPDALPDHAVLELVPDPDQTAAFWLGYESLHS